MLWGISVILLILVVFLYDMKVYESFKKRRELKVDFFNNNVYGHL
jgi:hypothetical protein